MKLFKRKAFTMAELLIVMGLIGVVAALTIPNLKDNADSHVNVAKAKKVYSEISGAFDRYTLKAKARPSDWTADFAMSGINNNVKVKGTGVDYWYQKGNEESPNACAEVATALEDGSTYCIVPYVDGEVVSTSCLDVLFDIDGPKKGFNEVGYDVFYASIRVPAVDSPEMVAWTCSDTGTFDTTIQPSSTNYLNWVVLYDNLDYRKCANTLYYQNVTSCN